jgi:hypothetical protein
MQTTPPTPKFGALPTPRSELEAATPHIATEPPGPHFIKIPQRISTWGNIWYSNCVTAEEAFAKACNDPEIFIPDEDVTIWANNHGVLNGTRITDVLSFMTYDGFLQGGKRYDDGIALSVTYTDAAKLQSAISKGPVKIGVAGGQLVLPWMLNLGRSGWFAVGFNESQNVNHCVSLCGYGAISWLAEQLKVNVPPRIDGSKRGYALFTWGSIGIIDESSLLRITTEAWLRQPTTVTDSVLPTDLTAIAIAGAPSVYHLTTNNHVHALGWGNNAWHALDLTNISKGPEAVSGSEVTVGLTSLIGGPLVYYPASFSPEGGTLHAVCELALRNDGWHSRNITKDIGAPGFSSSELTMAHGANYDPRVYYLDDNNHVCELAWGNNTWSYSDITKVCNGVAAVPRSAVAAIGIGNAPNVFYLSADNHVQQLWYGSGWNHNDLTNASGGTDAALGTVVTAMNIGDAPNVFYLSADNHVQQLWYGSNWNNTDITNASGGTDAASGSAVAALNIGGDPNVFYLSADNHVQQLWYGSGWNHNDLTHAAGAPFAVAGSAVAAAIGADGSPRVYYLADNKHVYELAWGNNTWNFKDITAAAGGGV